MFKSVIGLFHTLPYSACPNPNPNPKPNPIHISIHIPNPNPNWEANLSTVKCKTVDIRAKLLVTTIVLIPSGNKTRWSLGSEQVTTVSPMIS